jgi:hypothetical protein
MPNDLGKLARTARLLLMRVYKLCALRDGFTEGNTRFARYAFHIVLPPHSFDVYLKMELSHTGNNSLTNNIASKDVKG